MQAVPLYHRKECSRGVETARHRATPGASWHNLRSRTEKKTCGRGTSAEQDCRTHPEVGPTKDVVANSCANLLLTTQTSEACREQTKSAFRRQSVQVVRRISVHPEASVHRSSIQQRAPLDTRPTVSCHCSVCPSRVKRLLPFHHTSRVDAGVHTGWLEN
ncbi:unnamed protein product [Ectocarpus sp. 12 AP-2014]